MSDRKKKSWTMRALVGLTIALITGSIGFLVLLTLGIVSGEEFSPDDFSRRRFEYIRLPILNWVVRGIEYTDLSSNFEKSLGPDGWISTSPATTWHLYREFRNPESADCDARFLVELLTIKSDSDEYEYFWDEWNNQHPDLAKPFWPFVARLARDEMYLAMPEFMQLAMDVEKGPSIPDASSFENRLRQQLADSYLKFAQLDQAKGRSERALHRTKTAAEFRKK
jgi:hypothetical protein